MITDSNSLLGKTLGTSCVLECLLSQGGMGTVYLARQLRPRRAVAIKVLLPGPALNKQAQMDFLARFRREADAIAALDHINIMPIYEYGEQEQLAYLVMPHITGGTLRQRLLERGALPLSEALPILEQAAEALDYAHARGIIHRDIKPGNMIFHADGRLLLTDFGLAKILGASSEALPLSLPEHEGQSAAGSQPATEDATLALLPALPEQATQLISLALLETDATQMMRPGGQQASPFSSETIIGTPEYLAPERALGLPVDGRADIYALGIVLFQMLTGQVPFTGSSAISTALMHTEDEPPRPSDLVPDLAPVVEAVILRAIAKEPVQRYSTAGEFARALRTAHNTVAQRPVLVSSIPASKIEPIVVRSRTIRPRTSAPLSGQPALKNAPGVRNAFLVALCSLLILGGIFTYMAQKISVQHPVAAHTQKTPAGRPTGIPTLQPGANPTAQPTADPTSGTSAPLVPVGARLYTSQLLDSACPGVGGAWGQNTNARVTCDETTTELSNSLPPTISYLAGMFLDRLPDGSGIPNNYVLQCKVTQGPGSQGDFGVLFRSQPGHREGSYAFLINPNNDTWHAIVYDDVSGLPTYFVNGQFSVASSTSLTIDIILRENTFTFYVNGVSLGRFHGPSSPSYASGNIGFAVSTSTVALFSQLALYALPGEGS